MKSVYRGQVWVLCENNLCCSVNQGYCIFLKSSFQYQMNGRLKQNIYECKLDFSRLRGIQLRRCCSTGKDIVCFYLQRVTDLPKNFDQNKKKKNVIEVITVKRL